MTSANRAFVLAGLFSVLVPGPANAEGQAQLEPPSRPVFVSQPVGAHDHPGGPGPPRLPAGSQPVRPRDEASRGLRLHPDRIPDQAHGRPVVRAAAIDRRGPSTDGFGTLIHNYAGQTSNVSPPDTTGDVGPTYFVQSANQAVSTVRVIDKSTGANAKTFTIAVAGHIVAMQLRLLRRRW